MKKTNTGYRSTGHCSTGDCSTGHCSTGDCSTGDYSTGDCSTGNRSTGDYSTGHWSISNYSTGHFSTVDYSGFGAFDKPCTPDEWAKAERPDFIYFNLTEWVTEADMSEEEKESNPEYKTTGGYLKVYEYKEAWKKAWENATGDDKELLYALPNFDKAVFKKISGIDVDKDSKKEITIDGKTIEISLESFEALKKELLK